jgi:hypothetical protein
VYMQRKGPKTLARCRIGVVIDGSRDFAVLGSLNVR